MKYYIFCREDNDFSDILKDNNIKKMIKFKIKYLGHLIVGGEDIPDDLQSYILLKYGDDLKEKSSIFIDRKPIPFVDYFPNQDRPDKFKKL